MNCPFCDKYFKIDGKSYKDHILKHEDKTYNIFKCGICNKELNSRSSYDYHLNTHKGAERVKYECSICQSTFNCKYYRNIHEQNHTKKVITYEVPKEFFKTPRRPRYIIYEHDRHKVKRAIGIYETLQECITHTGLSRDVLQSLYLNKNKSSVSNKLIMSRLPKIDYKEVVLNCDLIFD